MAGTLGAGAVRCPGHLGRRDAGHHPAGVPVAGLRRPAQGDAAAGGRRTCRRRLWLRPDAGVAGLPLAGRQGVVSRHRQRPVPAHQRDRAGDAGGGLAPRPAARRLRTDRLGAAAGVHHGARAALQRGRTRRAVAGVRPAVGAGVHRGGAGAGPGRPHADLPARTRPRQGPCRARRPDRRTEPRRHRTPARLGADRARARTHAGVAVVHRPGQLQADQRPPRPCARRRLPARGDARGERAVPVRRPVGSAGRRGVRPGAFRRRTAGRPAHRRAGGHAHPAGLRQRGRRGGRRHRQYRRRTGAGRGFGGVPDRARTRPCMRPSVPAATA